MSRLAVKLVEAALILVACVLASVYGYYSHQR